MVKSNFEKFIESRLEEEKKTIIEEAKTDYIANLPDYDISLKQFIEEMKSDGLWDHVGEMSLVDLANVVNPSRPAGKGKRMTKAEKAKIMERIPEFLDRNSWSKKSDIARAIGVDGKKLNGPLHELIEARKIKKVGEKGGTRYTVVGDKAKPE